MKGLMVKLESSTASFRDPNTQLYQETLFAPPPTAVVGISGAALGMGYEEAIGFFYDNKIAIGSFARNSGHGRDLWNYDKIKGKEVIKAIVMREFLYKFESDIYFKAEDETIERLYGAFMNPVFVLSLGNSDELAKIKSVEIVEDVVKTETKMLRNGWIQGNQLNNFELDWEKVNSTPIKVTIKAPTIKNLPVDFSFKGEERTASKLEKFTFLEDKYTLKDPLEAYLFKDDAVALYEFGS